MNGYSWARTRPNAKFHMWPIGDDVASVCGRQRNTGLRYAPVGVWDSIEDRCPDCRWFSLVLITSATTDKARRQEQRRIATFENRRARLINELTKAREVSE